MKKIFVIVFAALVALQANAQVGKFGTGQDSVECVKYLSYYKEYVKHNNMADAIGPWRNAIAICPATASQNMLVDGQKIMRWAIGKEKNAEARKGLVDTLMKLYDLRVANYPKNAVSALNNKVIDMNKYNWHEDTPIILYEEMKGILKANGTQSSPLVYVKLMDVASKLYQAGTIDADMIMTDYNNISESIAASLAEKEDEKLQSALKDVETMFANSGVASCENMIALYEPRYNAAPEDKDNLTAIVKMLGRADCLDSELFLKAVESLHKIEPSAATAYNLYKLYSKADDTKNAVKFLKDAIEMTDAADTKQIASYYFELGQYNFKKAGNNAAAVEAAKKAAELDESLKGRAYLLIGTVWGQLRCGGNEVEGHAHFWVAYDYVNKAKAADPSLADDADALARQYAAYFPDKADAFMYDLVSGASYTVSCGGLREATTVRTN